MNSAVFVALVFVALEGAVMLLLPHYSPQRFLFAITVDPAFRASGPGREALRRYHREIAVVILLSVVAVVAAQPLPGLASMLAVLVPLVAGMAAFLHERNAVRRAFVPAHDLREAEITAEEERLPWWISLALPAFAAPAAAALYLKAHWEEIPARFPTHWGPNGPDAWAAKTPFNVYWTLLFAAALLLFMLLMTVGTYYGARRTVQRRVVLKVMVVAMYLLAVMFTEVSLTPLHGFSIRAIVAPIAVFAVIAAIWLYRAFHDPLHPAEATPDDRWYLGIFYFNPDDPAVFVQRRVGLGYTFNFGSRWAWIMTGVLVATVIGLGLARHA